MIKRHYFDLLFEKEEASFVVEETVQEDHSLYRTKLIGGSISLEEDFIENALVVIINLSDEAKGEELKEVDGKMLSIVYNLNV